MNRAVQGITDFIFMSDIPQKSDVILVPGTAHAQITEKAAQLYHQGYAPYILPSAGIPQSWAGLPARRSRIRAIRAITPRTLSI